MKQLKRLAVFFLCILAGQSHLAQAAESTALSRKSGVKLTGQTIRLSLHGDGTVADFDILRGGRWDAVGFRQDGYAGPAWIVEEKGQVRRIPLERKAAAVYEHTQDGMTFRLAYAIIGEKLAMTATLHNGGHTPFGPERAGIRLGLDCAQSKYPEWRRVFFPTLLRCEQTHFWGCFMNPTGNILGICSPDPIASWHNDYKQLGHLIFTSTIDLLNRGPLPQRHPQALNTIRPGETRSWTIYLEDIPSLNDVKRSLSDTTHAPMIEADRYTVTSSEAIRLAIWSEPPCRIEAVLPSGDTRSIEARGQGKGIYEATYNPEGRPGLHTIRVRAGNEKISEATLSVRHPWSWYLQQARKEAIAKPQKGSSHAETWMGLYSGFLARRHFPKKVVDSQIACKFDEIFPLMYDKTTGRPLATGPAGDSVNRIQNHALMAGLLAAKYRVTKDVHDLEMASSLADFMLTCQSADGAYRNGHTHYTSVTYCAKSIMEVMAEEHKLASTSLVWKEKFDRHYESVKRAIDELAHSLDNIQTEGEMTFEDGMIACSYTQLGLFALKQTDPILRKKYLDSALFLKNGHRCLSQLLVPDSRMNGGSLRYWESQYDVLLRPNMMNSPHGWSAWRIYGLWYLYLLTGEEDYLRQVQNALGSCVQVVAPDSGELQWAFVPDPYIRASVFEPDPKRPGKGRSVGRIIGEAYVPMISDWYKAPSNTWVTGYWGDDGGCCDNDVHEIFKCLEEVALTSAYVVERPSGDIATWNCSATNEQGITVVTPAEEVVSRIHLNLRTPHQIEVHFGNKQVVKGRWNGMNWIGPGGVPEILR